METLKKQFERIQQTLAGLSASQKMLTATLIIIMVMTLVYWGKYAGNSEMEALLNSPLSADDMARVRHVLEAENIPFDPSGDKIMVPTEKKDYALAALAYEQALPKDSAGSFDEIFSKINAFSPESTNDKLFNEATQKDLAGIIGKMKGVGGAFVKIDPSHERLIGENVEPSASVSITMRDPGTADKKLAIAVAELVAGTNAHMKRSRVSVIIDGTVWPIRDRDPNLPDGELPEQQAKAEERMQNQVKEALHYFQSDIIAVVHANIDAIASQSTDTKYPKIQTKDTKSENETTTSSTPNPTSAEPGAAANTGGSLSTTPTAGAENATSDTEHNTVQSQAFADQTVTSSTKPPGLATATSATVSVPRSYYVQLLKTKSGSDKEPADADVEKAFAANRDMVLHQVMNAVELKDEKAVSVDMYYDAPLMMAVGSSSSSGGGAGGSSSGTGMWAGHIKEIALGALALVSLFMVSTMVKKSSPVPVIATPAPVEQSVPTLLGRNLDIAGEVGEGNNALDGVEMDDDAVKSQQMVEQVSTLVKENPDAAATMVKRWLNRT